MNRYIYMGYYTTKENEKEIYYDSLLEKFYAVPYDFFENRKLENLGEEPEKESEYSELIQYEITDEYEIKALKSIIEFNTKKTPEIIERHEKQEVKHSEDEEKTPNKPYKKALIGSIVALSLCYIIYSSYNHFKYEIHNQLDEIVESLENKEETKEKYLKKITDALELNDSINADIKSIWLKDFTYFFHHNTFMTPFQMDAIAKRLNEGNFHDITEDNHIFALSKIIFDDDYSIYLGLTYQLDDMANEKDAIYNFDSYIFGYLSLGVKKDVMKETVLFGKDKYIDILAETYNVTPKEIKELTDLLDNYYHSSKEEQSKIYQEYVKKLGDILVRFYQTKGKLNEYEQFVLVSDIYNSKIVSAADILKTVDINNNLFNDLIVINVRDISYGNYNLYFDSKTHADITTLIYQEKLIDLLKNKGGNLDYDDPDARFLVYLYVLAYEDKFTMKDRKELFSSPNAEELARYIIESNFDNDYAIEMHFEFLYGYFSNGKINFKEMIDEIYGFSDDALSISLFIEYERCLKHEVLEGRLSEDAYQEQYDKLKERIAWGNDEIIEFVENAINNDESMFTDFNLPFSNIEYANDEIKKYTYETSEY